MTTHAGLLSPIELPGNSFDGFNILSLLNHNARAEMQTFTEADIFFGCVSHEDDAIYVETFVSDQYHLSTVLHKDSSMDYIVNGDSDTPDEVVALCLEVARKTVQQ
jgi:hypothetical protein